MQQIVRDRQQLVQVERTGVAVTGHRHRPAVPSFRPVAELPGQTAAAGNTQAALGQGWRDREVEHVLFDTVAIERPGDDARPPRRRREGGDRPGWAAEGQIK